MELVNIGRHPWIHCIWSGLGLLNLALFLHPMNPMDFLALAFSDPLQTVANQYGHAMAVLFWLSLMLTLSGLLGCSGILKLFPHLRHPKKYRRCAPSPTLAALRRRPRHYTVGRQSM